MVPDRLTRKVTVLVVSGMAIAQGERQVSRSGIEPHLGRTEKATARLSPKNSVHVEATQLATK